MKYLIFFFAFLFVNSAYSATCGAGYDFTWPGTPSTTCVYVFTAVIPGHPSINHIDWTIASSGTFGYACETITSTPNLTYTFCFHGNHDVTMTIYFNGGTSCTVTHTVNVSCTGSLLCDPDPTDPDFHPCPVVEVTYVAPHFCSPSNVTVSGCQYTSSGCSPFAYCISCGWTWAIRIPPTPYNCDPFKYWISYDSLYDCGSACKAYYLDVGTTYCINAKQGSAIYIVADGNHCCLPAGYQTAFIWTPNPDGTAGTIRQPTPKYGQCGSNRCPTTGSCTEDQQQMCETSGWPVNLCFSGGGPKLENRELSILAKNANMEQNVVIYNIQGTEVYNGKWKFGDLSYLYLNWPNNFGTGLYIVKFQYSGKLTKLYKFN